MSTVDQATLESVNQKRRGLLKLLAIGGGVLAARGLVNTFDLLKNSNPLSLSTQNFLSGFRISENRNEIIFANKRGEQLLVVEKSA
jgi:hypothetical protein